MAVFFDRIVTTGTCNKNTVNGFREVEISSVARSIEIRLGIDMP